MKYSIGGLVFAMLLLSFIPTTQVSAAENGSKICKGVYIGDLNAEGMTVDQVTELLKRKVNNVRAGEIVLSSGDGKKVKIKGSDLGITWENPEVVKEAYAVGHNGNVVDRYKELKELESKDEIFQMKYGFDDNAVAAVIRQCSTEFNKDNVTEEEDTKSKDKKGDKSKNKDKKAEEPKAALLVDIDESRQIIEDFVQNGWSEENREVELAVRKVTSTETDGEYAEAKDILGTYTTNYKTSNASRCANIENACSLINGKTLLPGEELSILDTITPFTEENGYFKAGSYLNGLVVESFGGGICQVSSTLYNAILLAELEVTERHNHSMIVNYVAPSADAAIAEDSGKDFKFVNNTDSPIYIEGVTTPDKNITFTIYGHETRSKERKVSFETVVLEKTPASEDKFITDSKQALGYVGMQAPHLGYKAQLCKVVKENGAEEKKVIINKSTYKMVPRIITIGTSGADENAMSQLKTAMATGDLGTIRAVASALGMAKNSSSTPASTTTESTGSTEQAAPATEQSTPSAGQSSSAASQSAPTTGQSSAATSQGAPATQKEQTTTVEQKTETAPAEQQQPEKSSSEKEESRSSDDNKHGGGRSRQPRED